MTCSPCSRYCPGAVPFGLASTTAPSSTCACRRLISGILQASPGKTRGDVLDDVLLLDERQSDRRRHRVAGEIVVGRSQATGHHDEIDARQCLPAQIGNQVPVVADHRFRAQLDANRESRSAMKRELVSSRVEPSSSEPTAMTSAVRSRPLMRGSHVPDSESKGEWLAY